MKTIIILLLSCASILAADTDIRVVSTSGTNEQRSFGYTHEVFTRDGQTNLISSTQMTPRGVSRLYRFYHAGQLVGNFIVAPEESIFNTEAGIYCMSLKYGPGGEIRSARIGDKQGILLDEFSYRNGVFTPLEGPLNQNRLMKPKFRSQDEFIKERSRAVDPRP